MKDNPHLTRDFMKNLGETKKEHIIHSENFEYGVKLVFKMRYATHVEVYYGNHREKEYELIAEAYQLNDTPNKLMKFGETDPSIQKMIETYCKKQYDLMEGDKMEFELQ